MPADTDAGVISPESVSRGPGSRHDPTPEFTPGELESALEATSTWLSSRQKDDGHFVGELEGDTILESEYVLLLAFFGREAEPVCVKACRYMLDRQRPDGGWAIYPGGPAEVSASVKAYFALKLVGVPVNDPAMIKARDAILAMGGAQACNSFTRFYLALLGQVSYDDCPTVPPELVLVPSRLNFSLAAMSAWTRPIVVPLAIMGAYRPVRKLPAGRGIAELFRDDLPRRPHRFTRNPFSWTNFFLGVDKALKLADRWLPRRWREPGLRAAHQWMFDRFENSDGLGAIFPPMIYTLVALRALGYENDSAAVRWAWDHLDDLIIEEGDGVRIQPCVSPVWDTAIASIALADAVGEDDPSVSRAARWLLGKEIRRAGDWKARRPGALASVEPSGWHFQYRNEFYPDIDDTAMVLLALKRSSVADEPETLACVNRATTWLLSLQNKDGGWAAFDADIDNEVLTKVPFADHNAMLDPSCADITARILEMLGTFGVAADHPQVARALDYLWRTQEPEGCWFGRWGVNYVYGTWQVLQGLAPLDIPADHPGLVRAADWLESVQQECGGWGETCASYEDRSLMGRGEVTASQTAWAVLGLIAAGRAESPSVRRGVRYLVDTQLDDGSWDETPFTGTGFPRVFYLKYHYYRIYFPLMALARYRGALGDPALASAGELARGAPAS